MLIGRDDELAAIRSALGDARLVTLVGPGGVGKTALATEIVADLVDVPTLFASLAPLEDVDFAERVGGSLGFSSFADLLADIETRGGLVVLDNCEHVLDAAAAVAERILAASGRARILATSRERLDVDAERVVPVHPLDTEGDPSPASRMFADVVRRRGLDEAETPETVAELCRRLDGLPLAIELAAARMSSLTAAEIIEHLGPGLDVLTRRRARGPERQHSLAATIAWSFRQLDADQRDVVTALSVPPGPCNIAMIAALSGRTIADARSIVAGLVERSLVVHDPAHGRSWYRMLDTIRSYCGDRLTDAERRAASVRLVDHLAAWADEMTGDATISNLSAPDELRQSFRVVSWATDAALAAGDRLLCHRLISPLWLLSDAGHQSESIELIRRVIDRWPGDTSPGATTCRGILASMQLVTSPPDVTTAAATAAAAGTGIGVAYGERVLGEIARSRGDWTEALEHYGRAADLARAEGHLGLALEVGLHQALTSARMGDLDTAIARYRAIIGASEGRPMVRAWASDFLSYVLLVVDTDESSAIATGLLDDAERAGNDWLAASAHCVLAFARLIDGRDDEAAHHTIRSIEINRAIRNRTDITFAFWAAAGVLARRGDFGAARSAMATNRHYRQSVIGRFEAELLERIGPIPGPDTDTVPMDADDIVRRLASTSSTTTHDPADEPGDGSTGGGDMRPGAAASAAGADSGRFVLVGDSWEITFAGSTVLMRSSKGLGDLARLLAEPGREFAALDLIGAGVVQGSAGPMSDEVARREYQERIRELQADIDEAERDADLARAERAADEMDRLVEQLSAAYGLSGRTRSDGDPAERARSAVTARVRAAIKRIAERHPTLGDHLDRNVRTGRFCRYEPSDSITWEVATSPTT